MTLQGNLSGLSVASYICFFGGLTQTTLVPRCLAIFSTTAT